MSEPQRSLVGGGGPREVSTFIATPQSDRSLEEDIDLQWYARVFGRHWILLLCTALAGTVAAVTVATLRPILYEGSTTLLVVPPPRAATSVVNPSTFKAMLENASLSAQVVGELGLAKAPHELTPHRFLERALTIEDVRGTNVVKVKVRLGDPVLAAEASRRLANKAIALTRQLNQQEGASIQEQLKNHLDDARARMVAAEKELLTYQQGAQIELMEEDIRSMLGERGELLELLISIESEKARMASAEQEIIRHDRILATPRAIGAEEALRRTDATSEVLDPSNPFINPVYQSLEYQIATGRARLAALEQQRRQVVEVKKLGGDAFGKLSELYSRKIEQARLQANYELTKRVYSDLAVRFEESRTQALGNSPQLQLVDDAIPAERPLSRRRTLWAALGFCTGLLGACLIALMWESRKSTRGRSGSL